MVQIPSSQNISRRTPSFARNIASADLSAPARALGQAGQAVSQVADQMAQAKEQEDKKLAQIQRAKADTSFSMDLNEKLIEFESDSDYATQTPRFEGYAQERLEASLQNISDPQERELFRQRGLATISSMKYKVNSNAHNLRKQYTKASTVDAINRLENTYKQSDPETRRENARNIARDIQTQFNARDLSPSEAQVLEQSVLETVGIGEAPPDLMDRMRYLQMKPAAMPKTTGNLVLDEGIELASAETGVPDWYLTRTAMIESGGKAIPNAQGTSYEGFFQFGVAEAKKYGVDRNDPLQAPMGAAKLAKDRKAFLESKLGREVGWDEVYLLHQQGEGGAWGLLSNPEMNVVDALKSRAKEYRNGEKDPKLAVLQNGGTLDMTGQQFADHIKNYFNGGDKLKYSAAIPAATRESMIADVIKSDPINFLKNINDFGFSADSLDEYKAIATSAASKKEANAKLEREANFIVNNTELYNKFLMEDGSGEFLSVADLDQQKDSIPPEMYESMRKDLMGRTVTPKTLEEQAQAFDEVLTAYGDLQIKKKTRKGKTTISSEGELEDLVRFQNKVKTMQSEGLLTKGEASTWLNRSAEAVINASKKEEGIKSLLGYEFDHDPIDIGYEAILDKFDGDDDLVEKKAAFSNYISLYDSAAIDEMPDGVEKNSEIIKIAQQAIILAAQSKTPSLRNLPDAPNAVLKPDGSISKVLPGNRQLESSQKITPKYTLKLGADGRKYKVFDDGTFEAIK